MTTILDAEEDKVIDDNGSARIPVDKKTAEELNLKSGEKITKAKIIGKHGFFLGTWNKYDQPAGESLDDEPEIEDKLDTLEELIESFFPEKQDDIIEAVRNEVENK